MGGRGAKLSGSPVAMTKDEFLAKRGLKDAMSGYGIDKTWGANQFRQTARGKERFLKEFAKNEAEYHNKRKAAISEYEQLVNSGKVREKSVIEKSLDIAHGHEDLPATHAARRMLSKRGYDWRTGKRLK